jgi:hypothetical protein
MEGFRIAQAGGGRVQHDVDEADLCSWNSRWGGT